MNKIILIITMTVLLIATVGNTYPVPKELVDGTITVTTKEGKTYTFSSNEYKVVKRTAKTKNEINLNVPVSNEEQKISTTEKVGFKHIISGEVVYSQNGLSTTKSPGYMKAENEYKLGLGIQYQYNIQDNVYLGGRVDSNGGTGLSVGFGLK